MLKHKLVFARSSKRSVFLHRMLSACIQVALAVVLVAAGVISAVNAQPAGQSGAPLPRCRVYPGGSSDRSKPVLILLQGWNTSATIKSNGQTSQVDNWRDLVSGLSDLYRGVVYFSYDRYSESYTPEDTYRSILTHHRQLLNDLIESCVQQGYSSFDLIGHSLGGVVALEYAKFHGFDHTPARVRHVVALDSPVNGGEQIYKLGYLPSSLDDVVVNVLTRLFGRIVLSTQPGDQTSFAEIAAMHTSPNTVLQNQQLIIPLLRRGIRVSTFTNDEDLAVLISDAMISGAFGRSFPLGYSLVRLDPGHGRILDVRSYPDVLAALRRELETPPPVPVAPDPGNTTATSTVLLLDVSGSMGSTWRGGIKMESAKNAATDLITMMEQEARTGNISHRVGVATFASAAELALAPTTDYAGAIGIVNGLFPFGGTNMGEGLRVANQALAGEPSGTQRFIILLSDGVTNEGLLPAQILSGPVQDAVAAGTCIYTVGFGEAGDLDENLLREIAAASGCGEYYYASDAYQLNKIYLELRHRSLGTVVASFSGEVQQDQTTPPQPFDVPAQQGELNITLAWPGSTLDLVVTDPRGRRVDSSYPGVSLAPYARFVYMIIQDPLPGMWNLAVFGRDVPEGIINYDAVASVRAGSAAPAIAVDLGSQALIFVAMTAILALVLSTFAIVRQSSRTPPTRAGVYVQQANGSGARAGFRRNILSVGRDPGNELVLEDDQVSRVHAQIRLEAGGYVLYDMKSMNGTFVNGQRINRSQLRPGDQIRVGHTNLIFFE